MTFGLENLHIFGKCSDFYCTAPWVLQGEGQGGTIPRAPNNCEGPKSRNAINTFVNTVHLLPKDVRFEHWGAKLDSCPRRHLTLLHPCTSRLSSQIGEICLQKYLPLSGKLSITSYLKQTAIDYQCHLTIENNLKVEKRYTISKTSTTFSSPEKNVWGKRRDKHTKKLESNNYPGTLPWKVFIASQGHWKWPYNIFHIKAGKWSLQWVNDQLFIHSIFWTKCDYVEVTQF